MADPMTMAFAVDSIAFTPAVVDGTVALGGSESSCLGLARALAARGHHVHIFASRLSPDVPRRDAAGVTWHPLEALAAVSEYMEWDALVIVRALHLLNQRRLHARFRIGWMHDLLTPGTFADMALSTSYALDRLAYVSAFQRTQWEELRPELAPLGWVTRNGIDLSLVPTVSVQRPRRIIHISRPERGLAPLLAMWPRVRQLFPDATLALCRYGHEAHVERAAQICAEADAAIAQVHAAVGGIEVLGALDKPALYRAISESVVMWYPGVADFAETSCIAALEAMACGVPFVGSFTGALPETAAPAYHAGHLLQGDAMSAAYQTAALATITDLFQRHASDDPSYMQLVDAGRAHVQAYAHAVVAAEWEAQLEGWFAARSATHRLGVLRALLQEDDHVAAQYVAKDVIRRAMEYSNADCVEAVTALERCHQVIAGEGQTAEQYAAHAIGDPVREAFLSPRLKLALRAFGRLSGPPTRLLDLACGHGAFAIAAAREWPTCQVLGIDYAEANIAKARDAADRAGVGDRCTFLCLPIYDAPARTLAPAFSDWMQGCVEDGAMFDALFCGEFLEHCAHATALIDGVEAVLADGAFVVYTVPHGNWSELLTWQEPNHRGHVHRLAHDDLRVVFGAKDRFTTQYLRVGETPRGMPVGNWLVTYVARATGHAAHRRPLATRIRRTRPLARLSVGLIAKDAETDLARCLQSIWPIADEIVVGDTGSTDATMAIAERYGARVLQLPPVEAFDDGFAGARNAVLDACTGDWFLWIDCDEVLYGATQLRRYLETGPFRAIGLLQNHLRLGPPLEPDRHLRVFRREPGIRFYGYVHEQPGDGDANTQIVPALAPSDVTLAHFGQLLPSMGLQKLVARNLPLLQREREEAPERHLGQLIMVREHVSLAELARAQGELDTAREHYEAAIALFGPPFSDPDHVLHGLARPFYEAALRALGRGVEIGFACGARYAASGPIAPGQSPAGVRWVVQTRAEAEALIARELREIYRAFDPPRLRTRPVLPPMEGAWH